MPQLRVAHLTSVHGALDPRIFFKEARSLKARGYDVCVIAQGDEPFVQDGVRIVTLPRARGRFERMTRTMAAMLRAAIKENADVYHLHDPELIPLGLFLRLRGKKVVYDAHEDLPYDIEVKDWIPSRIRPFVSGAAKWGLRAAGRRFTGVVAAVDTIAERFPQANVVVVRNLVDLSLQTPGEASLRVSHAAVYCGSITVVRGIVEMVQAFAPANISSGRRLALIGNFHDEAVESMVRNLSGWPNVDFYGRLRNDQIAPILQSARAGLCMLHATRGHLDSLPTKIFEYFAAGIPVIASDFPGWRALVEGCGISIDPNDPVALAQAIAYLDNHPEEAREMGERGRDRVMRELNWSSESSRLYWFYESLR